MNTSLEQLAHQAIALSQEDRAHLIDLLLASLPKEASTEAELEWEIEVERRIRSIEAGTAKLIAADEVHAQARKIFGP